MGRLAQGGVLHHVLGAFIDNIGVLLIHRENSNVRQLLPIRQQVIKSKPCRQFAFAVFLGDLVVQVSPIPHPSAVIVPHLDAVKFPDQLLLPGKQLEWLARPVVLPEYQKSKEPQNLVRSILAVPQLRAILRGRDMDERCQPYQLRHGAQLLRRSAPGTDFLVLPVRLPGGRSGGSGW